MIAYRSHITSSPSVPASTCLVAFGTDMELHYGAHGPHCRPTAANPANWFIQAIPDHKSWGHPKGSGERWPTEVMAFCSLYE